MTSSIGKTGEFGAEFVQSRRAAAVMHELRNCLQGIVIQASVLRRQETSLTQAGKEGIDRVMKLSRSAAVLLEQLDQPELAPVTPGTTPMEQVTREIPALFAAEALPAELKPRSIAGCPPAVVALLSSLFDFLNARFHHGMANAALQEGNVNRMVIRWVHTSSQLPSAANNVEQAEDSLWREAPDWLGLRKLARDLGGELAVCKYGTLVIELQLVLVPCD